jgi:peptidyl-prolyl cis-trans isomerase B (cyclophilin B)
MQKITLFLLACLLVFSAVQAKDKKNKNAKKQEEMVNEKVQEAVLSAEGTTKETQKMEAIEKKADEFTYVLIETNVGNIKLKLYNETPLHKANFIKIVEDGVLDSTLFHRVIPEFMIQGGDPQSKNAAPGQPLGMGGLNYRVPAEFNKNIIHKKGALAAARDGNPEKASSSTQFYIVVGKTFTDSELDILGNRTGNSWTAEQRTIYKEIGGTPMLDMQYTVFGETVEGQDIVDKIVMAPRDPRDRPNTDIRMLKVSIIR